MSGFTRLGDIGQDAFDWGTIGWRAGPQNGAGVVVLDVVLRPGGGHDFHRHPTQQEVLVVGSGTIRQYLAEESAVLAEGDSVLIDAGVVHASFNDGEVPAELQIVLTPALPEGTGYHADDVADQEPWRSLRG